MMHCAICRNGFESGLITMYVSGIYIIPLLSQNMMSGARFAGNQRPVHIVHVSSLVGTSETTRATSFGSNETRFNQWLAGLIDGDGSLQVSKAGYSSCEITVALADERMLRIIQNKLGGSIKPRSGVQAIR